MCSSAAPRRSCGKCPHKQGTTNVSDCVHAIVPMLLPFRFQMTTGLIQSHLSAHVAHRSLATYERIWLNPSLTTVSCSCDLCRNHPAPTNPCLHARYCSYSLSTPCLTMLMTMLMVQIPKVVASYIQWHTIAQGKPSLNVPAAEDHRTRPKPALLSALAGRLGTQRTRKH